VKITSEMRETTNLTDVDKAFGKWLRQAFENTVITDADRKENLAAIKFLKRPAIEKVVLFDDHGSPSEFVDRFERAAKSKGIEASVLPAVYYTSGSVIDSAALTDHIPVLLDSFESTEGGWDVETFIDKVALSYRVVVCAWDNPTLTALTLALRSFLRQSMLVRHASQYFKDSVAYEKYGVSTRFKAKTMLMGMPVTLDVDIDSLGSEMMSKVISDSQSKRLLSNEITISVIADTVTAFSFPNTAMRYEGSLKELIT